MRQLIVLVIFIFVGAIFLVSATELSGDGTHTIRKGDIVTIDNGWQVEVLGIFMAYNGEEIIFRTYDPEGNAYPSKPFQNTLSKIEGRQKYGTDNVLKIEIELLEISGETTPTGSRIVTQYEKAKVNIVTIDEALPGTVGRGIEDIEEVDKKLTYKNSKSISLKVGEETTLGNGYKLRLDAFNQRWGSPYFSLYDAKNSLIDENIGIGKNVGASLGSFVYVEDYTGESVDLKIVGGSKLTFGTGWNLFSINLEDGDGYGTILESTCNKATLWIWNNEIKDYEKIGILKEGTKISAKKGIWAKIQTKKNTNSDIDCEVIVSGRKSVSTQGQQLKLGWNLIGSPITSYGQVEVFEGGSNFNFLSFNDILGDCRIEKGPWQFLATDFVQVGQGSDLTNTNKYTKPFKDNLRLNRGYFIKVIDDCTLEG